MADTRVAESELISLGSGEHGRAVNVSSTALLEALGAEMMEIAEPA